MASEDKFAGGKGINMIVFQKRLDIENTAISFHRTFREDVLTEDISTNFGDGPRYTDQCQNQADEEAMGMVRSDGRLQLQG